MQMRAGCTTFLSDKADEVAALYLLANFHLHRALMNVHRKHTMPVIQNRRSTGQVEVGLGKGNLAIAGCMDRCTFWGGDIDPEVGRLWLTVENALTSEKATYDACDRPIERIRKSIASRITFSRLGNETILVVDPLLNIRRRRYEAFR